MTNAPGWTQEALLDEALDLIDAIDAETDPDKAKELDACFQAVTETMDALHKANSGTEDK